MIEFYAGYGFETAAWLHRISSQPRYGGLSRLSMGSDDIIAAIIEAG